MIHVPKLLAVFIAFMMFATNTARAITLDEIVKGGAPSQIVTYKTVGHVELKLAIFQPDDAKPSDKRPIFVWIHGGGWTAGEQKAFYPQARYSAARGVIGVSIDYRLMKPGRITAFDCFEDCEDAIRYVRSHAKEIGGDPDRIVALGDSSGGHLAACLGTLKPLPGEDTSVSAVPNAMVLCNPIVDCTDGTWWYAAYGPLPKHQPATKPSADVLERARQLSPIFHIEAGQPPTLIMHGLNDHVVNPDQARRFAAAMKAAGNRCDLILIENAKHAFVMTGYTAPPAVVVKAICDIDRFLASLGYLTGDPTLVQ